jgi:site-specific recombinase XerD
MPDATFFLKDKNSNKPTLIYLFFQFNHFEWVNGKKKFKVLKFSTQEKILPKFWNPEIQRARATKSFPEHSNLNDRLKDLGEITRDIYRDILNKGLEPNPELLRSKLNERLGRKSESIPTVIDLFSFIQQFIDDSKSGKRTTDNGKLISLATITAYIVTFNHLKKFSDTYKRKIDFDTIDLDFYDDFVKYFNKLNQATNSIGKHIKNLKVFLRSAAEKKLHTNNDYQNKRFRKIEEQTDSIYLRDPELSAIYNLDLSKNETRERTRDLFIVGCFTGLRFSDYNKIKAENIKKNEKGSFLHMKPQKTIETVVIPLNWMIQEILNKYDHCLPGAFTNQEMNRELKEIGKAANIEEKVIISITKGGMRTDTIYPKYKLISTHTARRSFATNAFLAGIPTISIMKITGHKTEKAFMRYIKISQEDNANKLVEHPYFSQQKPGDLKIVK